MGTPRATSGRNDAAIATTAPAATRMSVRSSDSALEATLGSTAIAAADANSAVRPAAYRPDGASTPGEQQPGGDQDARERERVGLDVVDAVAERATPRPRRRRAAG